MLFGDRLHKRFRLMQRLSRMAKNQDQATTAVAQEIKCGQRVVNTDYLTYDIYWTELITAPNLPNHPLIKVPLPSSLQSIHPNHIVAKYIPSSLYLAFWSSRLL